MRVLGLESSCDETAAAVVDDGHLVRGDAVASQVAIHAEYGGVVPELASRHHITSVIPVIHAALAQAGCTLDEIDAIAVTRGPGLVGALLVALQVGKALAWSRGLPLVGVNHLEGHLAAAFLDVEQPPVAPFLGLLVSGGHTELVHVLELGRYDSLSATRDDAAGEAFDKVGKMLGLGYPAGAVIDKLAATGDAKRWKFPRALKGKSLDFSFSGLKTALALHIEKHGVPAGQDLADLCASFQAAVLDQLVRKTALALEQTRARTLVVAGGVACNRGLRAALQKKCNELGVRFVIPAPSRCTDNAAMIAAAGYFRLMRGERADLRLNATASLRLGAA